MIKLHKDAVKLSRAQAFAAVTTLNAGGQLSALDLNGLLLYFAPAKKRAPTNAFEWVASVVNKKDHRECLHYVHVRAGVATATDGNRVHTAGNALGGSDGMYCPVTGLVTDYPLDKFPDVMRAVKNYGNHPIVDAAPESVLIDKVWATQFDNGATFDAKFYGDATPGDSWESFRMRCALVPCSRTHIPYRYGELMIENRFGTAYVMGRKV